MSNKNSYTYSIPVTVSDRLWYLIRVSEISVWVILCWCFFWGVSGVFLGYFWRLLGGFNYVSVRVLNIFLIVFIAIS